jgi:hypothetical protein
MPKEGLQSYHIGSHSLSVPLVAHSQLRTHLALLRAFRDLRTRVELCTRIEGIEGDGFFLLDPASDDTTRWSRFVARAVERCVSSCLGVKGSLTADLLRFERWITTLEEGVTPAHNDALIPLDVLMVWHAYLLNPGWYAEDCMRLSILHPFVNIQDHFLFVVVTVATCVRECR